MAAYADDPAAIQRHLLECGIQISGALPPLTGCAIRIGLRRRRAPRVPRRRR